jgi:RimJ/RimL family protein N-acetyltransferase
MPTIGAEAAAPFRPIETTRLILRRLEVTDSRAVEHLAGAVEVARMTANVPHPYPSGLAERWIRSTHGPLEAGTSAQLGIVLKAEGFLVGAIALVRDPPGTGAQIGYWLGVPWWGNGYMTEAVGAMLDHGRTALGLDHVSAQVFVGNPASARVLEKTGFEFVGETEQDFPLRGGRRRVKRFERRLTPAWSR